MCLDAGSTPAVSIYVWLRLIDTVKNVDKSTFFYFGLKKFEFFAFYLTIKISLILSHLVFPLIIFFIDLSVLTLLVPIEKYQSKITINNEYLFRKH